MGNSNNKADDPKSKWRKSCVLADNRPGHRHVKLFVGTWNVGDAAPTDLSYIPRDHDIYFIGTQECSFETPLDVCIDDEEEEVKDEEQYSFEEFYQLRRAASLQSIRRINSAKEKGGILENDSNDPWLTMLKGYFGNHMLCHAFEAMGSIKGALFCRDTHLSRLRNVAVAHQVDYH